MSKRFEFLCVTVLAILLVGTACRPKEIELPFDSIEQIPQMQTDKQWREREPGLMVMAGPEDLAQTDDLFSDDAQAQLQSLGFDQYFAVAVFEGLQGYLFPPPFGIEVQRVTKKGSVVTIHSATHRPTGEVERYPVEVSPYHLVKIQREKVKRGEIEFALIVDGKRVAQQTHRLP